MIILPVRHCWREPPRTKQTAQISSEVFGLNAESVSDQYASGMRSLIQDDLAAVKIEVPGQRAQVKDTVEALFYAMDAEVENLERKLAAIRMGRSEVDVAFVEFMSLTSEPAPAMQVRAAGKRVERACVQCADLVWNTKPSEVFDMELRFNADWSAKNSHQGLGFL